MIFSTTIPIKVKHLVQDINWNNTFIFEDMDCNHAPDAKEHLKVDCPKCNFDKREVWLEDHLNKLSGNEIMKDHTGINIKISKVIVVRGKYQDCIGVNCEY